MQLMMKRWNVDKNLCVKSAKPEKNYNIALGEHASRICNELNLLILITYCFSSNGNIDIGHFDFLFCHNFNYPLT